MIQDLFEVEKTPRASTNSQKHIKLYKFLRNYSTASNEEIMRHLGFASPASTYQFLKKLKYVVNTGKSRKSRWKLKNN
jgi:predicted HTH transcriptional regulator